MTEQELIVRWLRREALGWAKTPEGWAANDFADRIERGEYKQHMEGESDG